MRLVGLICLTHTSPFTSKYSVCVCVCFSDNVTQWKQGTCNCPSFLKNYICEHIIGPSIRLKYCKPPAEAKPIAIGTKRKGTRTSKAKKAFIKQLLFCC